MISEPEGRAAVRMNTFKHGPTAAETILPTVEDKLDSIREDFSTVSQHAAPQPQKSAQAPLAPAINPDSTEALGGQSEVG